MRTNKVNIKLWMITSDYFPNIGGAEKQLKVISSFLLRRGWNINILTRLHIPTKNYSKYITHHKRFELVDGVKVFRVPSQDLIKNGSISFLINSLKLLAFHRGKQNIFHSHGIGAPAFIAILAAKLYGGYAVIKLRSGKDKYINQKGLNLFLSSADRIIVVNKEMYKWLVTNYGLQKVFYMPNRVDMSLFTPASQDEKENLKKKMGFNGKLVFLYTGRLEKVKGIDILLEAWLRLPSYYKSISKLLIIGTGSAENFLKEFLSNDNDSIVWFGPVTTNITQYYKLADVFVLPSRVEGFSNSMAEAMASGLPVIATNVGGAADIIKDGENGILVPLGNPDALRDGIIKIIKMKDIWNILGANSRRFAEKELDISKSIDDLERIYYSFYER